jgi:WD40 repeat protein
MVSASDDLILWNADTGEKLSSIPQASWVTSVAFRGDSAVIATGHDDGQVRLWDVESEAMIAELKGHSMPLSALAFSPDGKRLASAGEDRHIYIWDLESQTIVRTLDGHTDRVPMLAWHPDGKLLVSAGWDTTARLWNADTGSPIILLNSHADQVLAVVFSPDGRLLACADSDHVIHVWDNFIGGKTAHVLHGHTDDIRTLAFSADSTRLASAGMDQAIHIWNPHEGKLVAGSNARSKHSIAVGSGPKPVLASSCGGTALQVWDLTTRENVPPSGAMVPNAVAISPNGKWLVTVGGRVTSGTESNLRIWELGTDKPPFDLLGHWGPGGFLTFSDDSKLFASACATDGTCWVWNVENRTEHLLIPEASDGCSVECVAFHPNGRWLACGGIDWLSTSGADGAICLWDIMEPKRLTVFEGGVSSMAFHPNGRWLAAASLEDTVLVWDLNENEATPKVLTGHLGRVTAVTYSPDGQWLVSASDDGTIRVWKSESGEAHVIRKLASPIKAMAFARDGQNLYTATANTLCQEIDFSALLHV